MTEFKVGDRVSASFEGEVTYAGADLVDIKTGGRIETVFKKSLTLLERKVEPLAPGSVVRSRYGGVWVVGRDGISYTDSLGKTSDDHGDTPLTLARAIHHNPRLFTLIHDGGNK